MRPFKILAFRVLFFSLILSFACQLVSAQAKVPITHESMWLLKRTGAPVVSPDGKWVVFSLTEPAYDEKEQVFGPVDSAGGRQCETAAADLDQGGRKRRGVVAGQHADRFFGQARNRRSESNLCAGCQRRRSGASDEYFHRRAQSAMAAGRPCHPVYQQCLSRRDK